MTWTYRSPKLFPARYAESMREAVASLEEPILMFSSPSRSAIEVHAERFRWFRWCVREKPEADSTMYAYSQLYSFRVSTGQIGPNTVLWLQATPDKLGELAALNPHLADLVSHYCQ